MTHAILDAALWGTEVVLFLGMAAAFIRLVLGPSLADRVVALDLIAVLMVGFMALFTLITGEAVYLDVAIALALVSFLATVAFARFAERRNAVLAGGAGPAPTEAAHD